MLCLNLYHVETVSPFVKLEIFEIYLLTKVPETGIQLHMVESFSKDLYVSDEEDD